MEAKDLFETLHRYCLRPPTTLCRLHLAEPRIPCPQSKFFCGNESGTEVVNFDAVKEKYCQEKGIQPVWKSVDAVLPKGDFFIFTEIKSWRNFEAYHLKDSLSEEETKNKIEAQAQGFKLKEKIESSARICKGLTNDEKLFDQIPTLYVLVTDVDTVMNPIVRFRAQLGVLSYKAVNIPLYAQASMAELNTSGMNVRYKNCREFDAFIDSL